MTFTLVSHTTRRVSCKQNRKLKRTFDLSPVIWKRQEATKAITVLMSFICEFHSLLCGKSISLCGTFSNLLTGLQNEISQLLLALRIYLHACCSI